MSISAIIIDPEDEFESSFMLPVATESFYTKYWLPAVDELNLQWAALFQDGTDVERRTFLPYSMKSPGSRNGHRPEWTGRTGSICSDGSSCSKRSCRRRIGEAAPSCI
ncbi:hypothetical protein N6H14_26915 [Paenibacillus sp. CC-CFT747]|nr:hypothetical protein N6H14_26915 [Paenibacillus sp. CC-CFT747]